MYSPTGTVALARLAVEKGATEVESPALIRRTLGAVVTITGGSRQEARERIRAWVLGGQPLSDLEAYLQQTRHLDPVGVDVARRVRGGGRGVS